MYHCPTRILCMRHITRMDSQLLTARPVVTGCCGRAPKEHRSCPRLDPRHPHLVVRLLFFATALFTPRSLLQKDTGTGQSEARLSLLHRESPRAGGNVGTFEETIIADLSLAVKHMTQGYRTLSRSDHSQSQCMKSFAFVLQQS